MVFLGESANINPISSFGQNELKLSLSAFDPHSDKMTRHNLKTPNRF